MSTLSPTHRVVCWQNYFQNSSERRLRNTISRVCCLPYQFAMCLKVFGNSRQYRVDSLMLSLRSKISPHAISSRDELNEESRKRRVKTFSMWLKFVFHFDEEENNRILFTSRVGSVHSLFSFIISSIFFFVVGRADDKHVFDLRSFIGRIGPRYKYFGFFFRAGLLNVEDEGIKTVSPLVYRNNLRACLWFVEWTAWR